MKSTNWNQKNSSLGIISLLIERRRGSVQSSPFLPYLTLSFLSSRKREFFVECTSNIGSR